jgi:hypothetical protein
MHPTCICHCSPLARPLGLTSGAAVILQKKQKETPVETNGVTQSIPQNPSQSRPRGRSERRRRRRRPARQPPATTGARGGGGPARGAMAAPGGGAEHDGGPRRRRGARRWPVGGRRRGRLGRPAERRPSPAAAPLGRPAAGAAPAAGVLPGARRRQRPPAAARG